MKRERGDEHEADLDRRPEAGFLQGVSPDVGPGPGGPGNRRGGRLSFAGESGGAEAFFQALEDAGGEEASET